MTESARSVVLQYQSAEGVTARELLWRWEKLRLLYNGILVITVLGIVMALTPPLLKTPQFWWNAVMSGMGANICFCLGPFVEVWLWALNRHRPWIWIVLFILGMCISFLAALVGVVAMLFSHVPM